jgi:hypothetical protein
MQVVKLSEDSRKLPEQVVLSVFVVIVLVDIDLLNVTATVVEAETSVELSVGLTEATVGAVVTVDTAPNFSKSLFLPYSLLSEQLLSNNTSVTRTKGKNRFILLDENT